MPRLILCGMRQVVSYANFEFAFWHPFGPHGGESPEQIIKRKRREIEKNEKGRWTLWSFQYRRSQTLDEWFRKLPSCGERNDERNKVFVFCSDSRAAKDPAGDGNQATPPSCKRYRFAGGTKWQRMPPQVKVPHPFRPGEKRVASAFVVQRVECLDEPLLLPVGVKWRRLKDGLWHHNKRVPTRGEYLIRRGGTIPMRRIRAVLELKWPYLAVVTAEEGAPD